MRATDGSQCCWHQLKKTIHKIWDSTFRRHSESAVLKPESPTNNRKLKTYFFPVISDNDETYIKDVTFYAFWFSSRILLQRHKIVYRLTQLLRCCDDDHTMRLPNGEMAAVSWNTLFVSQQSPTSSRFIFFYY